MMCNVGELGGKTYWNLLYERKNLFSIKKERKISEIKKKRAQESLNKLNHDHLSFASPSY